MKTQNVIIIDHTNKVVKNQLKFPVYENYDCPIIVFENQTHIGPFKTSSFPEKLALLGLAFQALFTGTFKFKIPVFTKVTK